MTDVEGPETREVTTEFEEQLSPEKAHAKTTVPRSSVLVGLRLIYKLINALFSQIKVCGTNERIKNFYTLKFGTDITELI